MPRRIDYVGRFEFIRQAAFAVVRDESADALSRRRVAKELGTGVNTIRRSVAGWADLARLAADQVVSRRRRGRWRRATDDPVEAAAITIKCLMPEDETHLDEELVWLKLVVGCALQPSGLEPPGHVRREFGIAQRGYDDGLPVDVPAGPGAPADQDVPAVESRSTALSAYVADRERELRSGVGDALALLGVPEPGDDVVSGVVAMIEGLTLSACLGRLTPADATRLAIAHVDGHRSLPPGAPVTDPPGSAG